jgi:hypothetical protein
MFGYRDEEKEGRKEGKEKGQITDVVVFAFGY